MDQTSLILQIIALVINASAIVLLVIAAGLFGNAHISLNENFRTDVCILYLSAENPTPSNSICVFSIVAEVLAALGLVGLIVLTVVKLVTKLMK